MRMPVKATPSRALTLSTPATSHIFGRVLDQITNSYKFFWLHALLSAVENGTELDLKVSKLVDDMVMAAWHPVALFRLSLGHQDRLQDSVSQLVSTTGLRPSAPATTKGLRIIRSALAETNPAGKLELERYVPFRFIAPWFETELRGRPDSEKDRRIQELAAQRFGGPNSAPYCFVNGVTQIRFDPGWHAWMRENLAILRAFADQGLIQFLQARNPSVPGIPAKLRAPFQRDLKRGRQFWKTAFPTLSTEGPNHEVRDIYTGAEVGPNFSLDHFLPWNFVAHDLLWNLVPVNPLTNSSKSDAVPDLDRYVPELAKLHHAALQSLREQPRLLSDHVEFMKLDTSSLLGLTVVALTERFATEFHPSAERAGLQGFRTRWRWEPGRTV